MSQPQQPPAGEQVGAHDITEVHPEWGAATAREEAAYLQSAEARLHGGTVPRKSQGGLAAQAQSVADKAARESGQERVTTEEDIKKHDIAPGTRRRIRFRRLPDQRSRLPGDRAAAFSFDFA